MAFTTSNGRTQTSLAEINVTPLVDVMLVLLIIFMVTAPVIQSGIEVDVPQTRTVKNLTHESITVNIDRKGSLYVGNDRMNINDLASHLKTLMRNASSQDVYVRADKEVSWGTMAKVVDTLRLGGIEKITMVTKPYDGKK